MYICACMLNMNESYEFIVEMRVGFNYIILLFSSPEGIAL